MPRQWSWKDISFVAGDLIELRRALDIAGIDLPHLLRELRDPSHQSWLETSRRLAAWREHFGPLTELWPEVTA